MKEWVNGYVLSIYFGVKNHMKPAAGQKASYSPLHLSEYMNLSMMAQQ